MWFECLTGNFLYRQRSFIECGQCYIHQVSNQIDLTNLNIDLLYTRHCLIITSVNIYFYLVHDLKGSKRLSWKFPRSMSWTWVCLCVWNLTSVTSMFPSCIKCWSPFWTVTSPWISMSKVGVSGAINFVVPKGWSILASTDKENSFQCSNVKCECQNPFFSRSFIFLTFYM